MNILSSGTELAIHSGMKNTNLFTILMILFWASGFQFVYPQTGGQGSEGIPGKRRIVDSEVNVNERYTVESITFRGIAISKIDKNWHKNAKELVGERYNEKAANDLAKKLSDALGGNYRVEIKVEKGEKPDHVKVVFQLERIHRYFHRNAFDTDIPLVVYHSKQGFSGTLEIPIRLRHNVFTFGIVSDVDKLLERNAGIRLRYEHRKVGTDKLRLRMDFNSYHQSFNAAILAALEDRPDVPGIYRTRQNFAPALSLHPTADLKLSTGVSFQRLQMQYPTLRTERAYAGTADVQFLRDIESRSGYWHRMGASYGLRTATRVLDSDFVYTRHQMTGDYILSRGKHLFGAHFFGGLITGNAPLFERFSLGNSATLRGWNKFDVAPLGGNRAAHGTLEYRYSHFQLFYDFGAVWDKGMPSHAKHGLGFGLVSKHAFMSLAFPVRHRNVVPVFIMGIRY